MSIGHLRDNLQEIYVAAHAPDPDAHANLVPNLWGTRVYYAHAGWGRLWKWIFSIIEFFSGKGLMESRLAQAIQKTHEIFQELLPQMQAQDETLRKHIAESGKGMEVDEHAVADARRKIIEWDHAVRPFLKLQEKGDPRIQNLFSEILGADQTPFQGVELSELQDLEMCIEIEGWRNQAHPLEALDRLILRKKLRKEYEEQLKEWLQGLAALGDKLPIRHFHRFLKYYHQRCCKAHPNNTKKLDLASFEHRLFSMQREIDAHFNTFLQEDPKVCAWRDALEPGMEIALGEKKFILEERVREIPSGHDAHHHIWSLKEHPHQQLIVGYNQAVLGLKQKEQESAQDLVGAANIEEIHPKGIYGVMEPVRELFSTYRYGTDRAKDQAIVEFLKDQIEDECTLEDLDVEKFYFDAKGNLRSIEPLDYHHDDDFDAVGIESFIYQCTRHDLQMYHQLMQQCGFQEHSSTHFMKEVGEDPFKYDIRNARSLDKEIRRLAQLRKILDPLVVERAKELVKELYQMVNAKESKKQVLEKFQKEGVAWRVWARDCEGERL